MLYIQKCLNIFNAKRESKGNHGLLFVRQKEPDGWDWTFTLGCLMWYQGIRKQKAVFCKEKARLSTSAKE